MSLHRYAPKRDGNEPEIRKRFAHHGWHTEQLSGAGMPDLLCMKSVRHFGQARPQPVLFLTDVKEPNGKVTPPQAKKWAALRAKGIPVYVARTEADVDAIVAGTAKPWEPEERGKRKPNYTPPRTKPKSKADKRIGETLPTLASELFREMMKPPGHEDYDAALKRAMQAAKEAEVFASPEEDSEAWERGERS